MIEMFGVDRGALVREFDKAVDKLFEKHSSSEIMAKFVKTHERKELVINNLYDQVVLVEKSNIKTRFTTQKYEELIDCVAKMFARNCIEKAEQDALSWSEIARRVSEADTIKRAAECIEDLEAEVNAPLKSMPGEVAR